MKRFYQFFTFVFVALAVVACGDKNADLKADLQAFDAATEQNGNLAEIQKFQTELMSAATPEDQAVIFNKIADKYKEIKASVEGLKIKTAEAKALQGKFTSGFDDFIKLMTDSATYVVTPPTAEQQQALVTLQQQATTKLLEAAQGIQTLKEQVEKK
ncbi:hypothetical protein FHQ26_05290 [Testudinibacter sp. TR-2022]|uniref:hypothetical protein n=1 Tax=Testudinibacter sp. TR-2022 TaxID=2585029 RepID=UPI00111A7D27|nr:hypothetical protein [Testudinibacter sp. TR-2022]TNG91910.1 hypothetical protein FHQ20_10585 [Pasteurellaceae bacterium USgator41]TNG94223.1 hypothetical protein FHQ19_08525 [Pasteurellaceae bacterium UScroc12]TNG98615.1 hypothetical protein FHQ24_08180 [Pasteurellaceae bacterium UScroc31]TNH00368.1 hypothetical protein FHQ22_12130 [Pasteurellaceae bacterium Phil31]TNH01262.1 hypothetical protein FHQ28_06365 [Pasteurellaceae bacterium USgator11]TNH07019.1 hypothetical protein FHQ30_05500 